MSASQPAPPITAASDSMQQLKSLMRKRTELESQIEALSSRGSTAQPGESLVDADGFPRSDVDVHGARIARQSLAQLQTDHVAVMKEIETGLFALHAEAKRNKQAAQQSQPPTAAASASSANSHAARPTASNDRILAVSAPQEQKQPQQPAIVASAPPPPPALSPLDAFFLVDQVFEDSPAQSAGLHIGDKVLQFGSVTKDNNSKDAMRGVVSNSVGRGVRVVVYRVGDGLVTLQLIPQRWSGQGLLGCHLADC